jgi:hypothetical protein
MHAAKRWGWMLAGFFAGFLAVGVPYWSIPYSQIGLPYSLIGPGLLVVVVAALVLRATGAASVWEAVLTMGASVPACVLARVGVDGATDPTSHNLWPLEVILSLPVGAAAGLAGAVLGGLIARLRARQAGRG